MSKAFAPQVLTANRLRAGDTVYLAANDDWVPELARASVALNAAELDALKKIAERAVAAQHVVGVYEMDVDLAAGAPQPTSVKERIRAARGPTV
jgi:Protein of unknown function (DUF2849)